MPNPAITPLAVRVLSMAAISVVAVICVACGGGYETAVRNNSTSPLVASGRDWRGGHDADIFFLVRPTETVVVDTVGHENPSTDRVVLFDLQCQKLSEFDRDFSEGALITLTTDNTLEIEIRRPIAGGLTGGLIQVGEPTSNGASGRSGDLSCADAAARALVPR
jgi:hypothetical protein